MLPSQRQRALQTLLRSHDPPKVLLCRDVEAVIHASATSESEYKDLLLRACFNMKANTALDDPSLIATAPDNLLTAGTLLERIETEVAARRARFENMLQEKYEALDDRTYEAIVRCRRCGSSEISWEEKQTRSADEAMTLFCVCTKCKNRWVMR